MRTLVVAAALVLAACANAQDPAGTPEAVLAEVGEEFVVAVGGEARLPDGLTVTLVAVAGDSRCPSDVECPWEGSVEVRLRVTVDGETHDVALGTFQEEAAVSRYVVSLVEVAPEPVSTRAIAQGEYRITLRVERRALDDA